MPHIPVSILGKRLLIDGLTLRHQGKVRDSYDLPGFPGLMLVVASDCCSIFDFVLPTLVPLKGEVLTAMNHFWRTKVIKGMCPTDFVAAGADIDAYLPEHLRGDIELQKRATVVRIVSAPDFEDIVRFYLTGNGWTSYRETGKAFEYALPSGLIDGSLLPFALYTPTTKADKGHDESVSADFVAAKHGPRRERLALQLAALVAAYAKTRGIILADTKFEFSADGGQNGDRLTLVDEVATPDSSRFWDENGWKKAHAKGALPPSSDKQHVRNWGKENHVERDATGRKRQPENAEDLAYIDGLSIPGDVIEATTRLYRYIFWRLTGMKLETYQRDVMGIKVETPKPRISILVGSESDLGQIRTSCDMLAGFADIHLSVVSCHRNPTDLRMLVREPKTGLACSNIIIAGAGMAAALPGIVKSDLCEFGFSNIPVIGVAFKGSTPEDDLAAKLSIKCLPGKPVELDPNGEAYFGPEGFLAACKAALDDEFLPKTIVAKPAKIGISPLTFN